MVTLLRLPEKGCRGKEKFLGNPGTNPPVGFLNTPLEGNISILYPGNVKRRGPVN